MAERVVVEIEALEQDRYKYCKELEAGNILFFPSIPFPFPKEDIDFLLKQRQGGSASRKNIAYKPQSDKITNHNTKDDESAAKIKTILTNYSRNASTFLAEVLSPYASEWKLDYASFRPYEEKGRKLRLRARNDLLHVDAFPTRPMHGKRILRFFTNINQNESRNWITSDGFKTLAERFLKDVALPDAPQYDFRSRLIRKAKVAMLKKGVKIALRSPYDEYMLRLHHFLKENSHFQETCQKDCWAFPPSSCWAVFTDQVSHAALSGQYALEQTFIVPQRALLNPENSPAGILERLSYKNVIDQEFLALH